MRFFHGIVTYIFVCVCVYPCVYTHQIYFFGMELRADILESGSII